LSEKKEEVIRRFRPKLTANITLDPEGLEVTGLPESYAAIKITVYRGSEAKNPL